MDKPLVLLDSEQDYLILTTSVTDDSGPEIFPQFMEARQKSKLLLHYTCPK